MNSALSFRPLALAFQAPLAFFFLGCATIDEGEIKAEVDPTAAALAARINACNATFETVSARKSASLNSSRTMTRTTTYSGCRISPEGNLYLTETTQENVRKRFFDDVQNESNSFSTSRSLPLGKVEEILISEQRHLFYNAGPELEVHQDANRATAKLRSKAAYDVDVLCGGAKCIVTKTTGHSGTSSSRESSGTVASFNSRADAISFARDLQTLVAKYRQGQAPKFSIGS